jgi:hypothetical protein
VAAGFGPKPQRFGVGQPSDAMRRAGLPERAHPYSASAEQGPRHLGAGGRATGLRLGKLASRETMRRCRGHRLENPQSRAKARELFGASEPAAQSNGGPTSPSGRAVKPELAEPPLYGGGKGGMPAHHLSFGREGAARVEALEPFGARVLSPSQRRKTPSGVRNRRFAPALPTFGSAATGHAEPTVNRKRVRGRDESLRRHDDASRKGAYCAGPRESPPGAPPRRRTFGSQSATRRPPVPDREKRPSGHGLRDSISGASTERRSAANPPKSAPWGARPREGTLGFPTARKRLGANQRKEPSGSGPREELRSTRKRQGDHGCPSKGRRLRTPDRGRTPRGSESAQNPRVLDARRTPLAHDRRTDPRGPDRSGNLRVPTAKRRPRASDREKEPSGSGPCDDVHRCRTEERNLRAPNQGKALRIQTA